ncbi:MAG: preprotein translocase subunit SecE [Bacteroidetes bacterium]|jgi:preprotein translocase subunit SecE|nr:preprotein translocase subunit SecE [Bacteroidota bacterium]
MTEKLTQYFKDSYQELMYKVTWPTVAELQSSTAVVFVASLIIALMIALMDQITRLSLQGFYGLFS